MKLCICAPSDRTETKELNQRLADAVYYHMNWLHRPKEELPKALDPNRPLHIRIVQYANAMAARRWASFLPGIGVSEEALKNYNIEDVKKAFSLFWKRDK